VSGVSKHHSQTLFKMILSENRKLYFQNFFSIPSQVTESTIDKLERLAMMKLLGVYAYDEFSEDLSNGVPNSEKWKTFVNGENYENNAGLAVKYDGVKNLLQAYVSSQLSSGYNYMTGVGYVSPSPENSSRASAVFNQLESNKRFNSFVQEFCSAENYVIQVNDEIERTADSIVDNLDNTYTVTADTELINVKSQIEIGNNFYNVNFVDATTFKIDASTGQTFELEFKFRKYNRFAPEAVSEKKILSYGKH